MFVAMGLRAAAGAAEGADFSPERWNFRAAASAVEEKLGRRSLFLRGGHAYYQDVAFADGWLEVDLAFPRQRTFGGVLFRVVAEGHQEKIYLRPHKSGLDDALQYEAVFDGSTTWQLYSAPTYMRPLDIPKEEWCRLRVVFSGDEAKVYFDGDPEPAMVVSDLKRDYAKGGIGLWAGPGGAWFSNLRYSAAPEAPPPPRTEAALHPGIVQRWELSEAFAAEDALPERLPAISGWQPVGVEPPGILVIDRYRKSSSTLPPSMEYVQRLGRANGRRIVYARAVVESQSEQVKRMSFGYSDEVSIFLNGRILFTGRSAFRFRDPGFMGVMDVENDAVYLPLAKGRNEIVVGVAEFFGGWGLTARFDDPAGLQLP
ncbi:MAG: family 16 glycoside hydrolase [Myxococcota bacterium]